MKDHGKERDGEIEEKKCIRATIEHAALANAWCCVLLRPPKCEATGRFWFPLPPSSHLLYHSLFLSLFFLFFHGIAS